MSMQGRCSILTSSLVRLESETRYVLMEIYMYAYIMIEWSWDIMTDVIEYMLHRPIHSCWIGWWAYTLFGYDLAYASLRSIRGQIIVDFVIEHRINVMHNINISLVSLVLWRLCFDSWIHNNGHSVGVVYISPYSDVLWSLAS